RSLVPVRVRECSPDGLLNQIVYIDLVGLDEDAAERDLLAGLKLARGKPTKKPAFPRPQGEAEAVSGGGGGGQTAGGEKTGGAKRPGIPKIRRAATDLDKRRFIKESFDTIRERFRGSLAEMAQHDAGVEFDLTEVDATKFMAEIFVDGESRARCKIWQGAFGG